MEKSSSEDSSIRRSPSLESKDSDFAKASPTGKRFSRGFTAGAFYGTAGPRRQGRPGSGAGAPAGSGLQRDEPRNANAAAANSSSKYLVFYLDLSFVFLLEFKKCSMARGCLCCLKYMMFLFNLIFWVSKKSPVGLIFWGGFSPPPLFFPLLPVSSAGIKTPPPFLFHFLLTFTG